MTRVKKVKKVNGEAREGDLGYKKIDDEEGKAPISPIPYLSILD